MILALIQKDPLARFRRACAHKLDTLGRQQLRRIARDRPQWRKQIVTVRFKFPLKALLAGHQHQMLRYLLHVLIQNREGRRWHRLLPSERIRNSADSFAQLNCRTVRTLRLIRILHALRHQSVYLLVTENARVLGKASQIDVVF